MARLRSMDEHHVEAFMELVARNYPIKHAYRGLYEKFGHPECPLCPHFDGEAEPPAVSHSLCGFDDDQHLTYPAFWKYTASDEGKAKLEKVRARLRAEATHSSYADTRNRIISLVDKYELIEQRIRDPHDPPTKADLISYSKEQRMLDRAIRDNLDHLERRVQDSTARTPKPERESTSRDDVDDLLDDADLPQHVKDRISRTFDENRTEDEVH